MEKQLLLITSIIVVGMTIAYPSPRDTDVQFNKCNKNTPHVVLINKTDGSFITCKECIHCQHGLGLPIACTGENVTNENLVHSCVECVSGVNFSTGETIQCQPCSKKVCKDGVEVVGNCEAEADKRSCKYCKENFYYNTTMKMCLPCSCKNMTNNIKQICKGIGYDMNDCIDNGRTRTTLVPTTTPPVNKGRGFWNATYTVIIACVVAVLLLIYLCLVTWRWFKFKPNHEHFTKFSKQGICKIFCCCKVAPSRPPSYSEHDRHTQNNGNCAGRAVYYFRQNSCPVTQNEKYSVGQSHRVPSEQYNGYEGIIPLIPGTSTEHCLKKDLKFFDMNSETCRQVCVALKDNVATGRGYPTLAGFMHFTANDVKTFERSDDPCKSMFQCWNDQNNKENTVLKLTDLVRRLKRDDVLQLLQGELHLKEIECNCSECVGICC